MSVDSTQIQTDEQHLRLLSIFHFVVGGFQFMFGCFPFFHLAFGIAILNGAFDSNSNRGGFPIQNGMNQQAELEAPLEDEDQDFVSETPRDRAFGRHGGPFGPGFPANGPQELPPAFGWMIITMAIAMILFMWSIASLMLLAGWKLFRHRSHTYCFVVACVECVFMPLGTVLGIFTILTLARPSVKELFQVK